MARLEASLARENCAAEVYASIRRDSTPNRTWADICGMGGGVIV